MSRRRSALAVLALLAAPPLAVAAGNPDAPGWVPKRVAELQMLDKVTARVSVIRVPVDQPAQFGTLTIHVAACNARPPDEVPDAAAWLAISDSRRPADRQLVFRGWMFANAPGVHMLEHPVYDVRVLECRDAA